MSEQPPTWRHAYNTHMFAGFLLASRNFMLWSERRHQWVPII
jgi:hypothetical protein